MMSLICVFMLTTLAFALPRQQEGSQGQTSDGMKSGGMKQDKHDRAAQSDSTQNMSPNTMPDASDRKFIMEAAHGGMMGISLGHTAVDKAANPDVKQFAQRLADDHSKANSELMRLASQKGVDLPSDNNAMNNQSSSMSGPMTQSGMSQTGTDSTGEHHARMISDEMMKNQAGMNKLSRLSGDAFDREYVNMMVKDHEKDVKEFEKASRKAKDPDVRAWAAKTLPTLREHLQQVRDIQSHMESSMKSGMKSSK